jgi:hypothetical protein
MLECWFVDIRIRALGQTSYRSVMMYLLTKKPILRSRLIGIDGEVKLEKKFWPSFVITEPPTTSAPEVAVAPYCVPGCVLGDVAMLLCFLID